MKLPILYALSYPNRYQYGKIQTDFKKISQLTFFEPDFNKFECLKLAYDVITEGGAAPCILNAANEVAVNKFLSGNIKFTDISGLITDALEKINNHNNTTLETIYEYDFRTREYLNRKYH
jgi:1-deoxy-D-xylulose-5-phosphate reductoisomerase